MTEAAEAPVQRGVLIVMEGADYTGKTTQRELLATRLRAEGYDVVETREPGGTPYAEKIRELMLFRADDCESVSPLTEMLLAYAARTQHIEHVIAPALAAGKVVITDRWVTSTFCYQVWPYIDGNMQHGLLNVFMGLNGSVLAGIITEDPLVLIMDVSNETRTARHALNGNPDVMEKRDNAFMDKVVAAYTQHAGAPNHQTIDANRSIEEIAADVYTQFVAYHGATMEMRLLLARQQEQIKAGQRPDADGQMGQMPPELAALVDQIQQHGGYEAPDHSYETAVKNGFPGTEQDWVDHLSNMQQIELNQQAVDRAAANGDKPQNTLAENTAAMADLVHRYDHDRGSLTAQEVASVEGLRAQAKQAMDAMVATSEELTGGLKGIEPTLETSEGVPVEKPADHVYTQ